MGILDDTTDDLNVGISRGVFVIVGISRQQEYTDEISGIISYDDYISKPFIIWNFVLYHVKQVNTPYFIEMIIYYLISRIISLCSFRVYFINEYFR